MISSIGFRLLSGGLSALVLSWLASAAAAQSQSESWLGGTNRIVTSPADTKVGIFVPSLPFKEAP